MESPYDEKELVEANKAFLFENMPTIKNIQVHFVESEEAKAVEGAEAAREAAVPGKPQVHFY